MSHKILAEKYAQQLNDANKRILELETTVADREYDLEQAKAAIIPQGVEDSEEIERLRDELADRDKRIIELDRQLKDYLSGQNEVNDSRLAHAEAQLELATERAQHLEKTEERRHERLLALQAQLKTTQESATAGAQSAREHVRSIESWAKAEVDKMLQQKQQAVRQLEAERASHDAQSGPSSDRIKFLEKALGDSNRLALSQSAESLRIENDHLVKCIRETSMEKFDLRKRVTKLTKEYERTSQADRRVAELEARLGQERKRTLAAEAMLGPEGKRCRKCNPVVVDLMDDDVDMSEVIS